MVLIQRTNTPSLFSLLKEACRAKCMGVHLYWSELRMFQVVPFYNTACAYFIRTTSFCKEILQIAFLVDCIHSTLLTTSIHQLCCPYYLPKWHCPCPKWLLIQIGCKIANERVKLPSINRSTWLSQNQEGQSTALFSLPLTPNHEDSSPHPMCAISVFSVSHSKVFILSHLKLPCSNFIIFPFVFPSVEIFCHRHYDWSFHF